MPKARFGVGACTQRSPLPTAEDRGGPLPTVFGCQLIPGARAGLGRYVGAVLWGQEDAQHLGVPMAWTTWGRSLVRAPRGDGE